MNKLLAAMALMTCSLSAAGYPTNNQNPAYSGSGVNTPSTVNTPNPTINPTPTRSPLSPSTPSTVNTPGMRQPTDINEPTRLRDARDPAPTLNPTGAQNPQGNYRSVPNASGSNNSSYRKAPGQSNSDTAEIEVQMQKAQENTKYPQDIANTFKDREINDKIRAKITGWFVDDYKNVILNTDNGVVTLSGFVEKQETANDLADQVRKIDGVREVKNNIRATKVN